MGRCVPRKFPGVREAIVISTGRTTNHHFLVDVSQYGIARWSISRAASVEA